MSQPDSCRPTRRTFVAGGALVLAAGPVRAVGAQSGRTLLVTHPAFTRHETGLGNPERPARMRAIDEALAGPDFATLRREEAPLRDDAEAAILRAHTQLGLDHNETRSWHGWHRHVSLVMMAFALLAVIRHHANAPPPKSRIRTYRRGP